MIYIYTCIGLFLCYSSYSQVKIKTIESDSNIVSMILNDNDTTKITTIRYKFSDFIPINSEESKLVSFGYKQDSIIPEELNFVDVEFNSPYEKSIELRRVCDLNYSQINGNIFQSVANLPKSIRLKIKDSKINLWGVTVYVSASKNKVEKVKLIINTDENNTLEISEDELLIIYNSLMNTEINFKLPENVDYTRKKINGSISTTYILGGKASKNWTKYEK